MISISVSNLAFRTGTREILAGVTFSLEEGDRLAIVGVKNTPTTRARSISPETNPWACSIRTTPSI